MPTGFYPRKPLLERFNEGYTPEPFSGCWLWTSRLSSEGYGVMSVNDRLQYLHRVSWMIHRGEIPNGLCVLHKCDTRCCVNPDHLFLGTRTDNQRDMVSKGRSCIGERQGRSKLTKDQVVEIRKSSEGLDALAKKYRIHPEHVRAIRRRTFWSHVQ